MKKLRWRCGEDVVETVATGESRMMSGAMWRALGDGDSRSRARDEVVRWQEKRVLQEVKWVIMKDNESEREGVLLRC